MCTSRSTHILNIKTCMNYYTGTQEQQSFKASMCHQMIHCKSIMAHRLSNHHVTQLATSTICNYTFYIILHNTHTSSHLSGYCSNNCQSRSARYALFPKRICTCNQKNSSSNQSSSMDQSGNGCRTFHSIC